MFENSGANAFAGDGEKFATLLGGIPLTAQAHHQSGCMGGTVSSSRLRLTKFIPVSAPVQSCARFDVFHGDLLQCAMEMAKREIEWSKCPPHVGYAWDSKLHGGLMHSLPFKFLQACASLRCVSLIIDHRSEGACW